MTWYRSPYADDRPPQVLIAGGGIAGLYAAHRLLSAREPKRVLIVEPTPRLGGRILTLAAEGLGWSLDGGAMRYLARQPLISNLVETLGLEDDRYEFRVPTDSWFLRGRDLVMADHQPELLDRYSRRQADRVPLEGRQDAYRSLERGEGGRPPEELIRLAISRFLSKVELNHPADQDRGPKLTDDGRKELEGSLKECDQTIRASIGLTFDTFTPLQWQYVKRWGKYDGTHLYELSFWDVIQSQLSPEAYSLSEHGLGYHTIMSAWNAAEAIPWFLLDFPAAQATSPNGTTPGGRQDVSARQLASSQYRSLSGGMQRLVQALEKRVYDRARECFPELADEPQRLVLHGARVKSFRWEDGSGRIVVTATRRVGEDEAPVREEPTEIETDHLLFAVGQAALRSIFFESLADQPDVLDRELRERLNAVTPQPLVKMFWVFDRAWWWDDLPESAKAGAAGLEAPPEEDEGPEATNDAHRREPNAPNRERARQRAARIVTDLPIRQLYLHGADSASASPSTGRPGGMIMCYSDARYAAYWSSLSKKGEGPSEGSRDPEVSEELRQLEKAYGATKLLRERVASELCRIFDHRLTPRPPEAETRSDRVRRGYRRPKGEWDHARHGFIVDWSKDPFLGGWHTWNVGREAQTDRRKMASPLEGRRIYVCGEAFSADQGWIEGALRSTERVLTFLLDDAVEPLEGELDDRCREIGYEGLEAYLRW